MTTPYDSVLLGQNTHWDSVPYKHAFWRTHEKKSIDRLNLEEIEVITGIRRCGKSTLLQTMINQLMKTHDPKSILYINFDDPGYTIVRTDARKFYDILTAAETLTQQPIQYLFLDEVQNVEGWEQYVKSVYDAKRFKKIAVTGSNAKLLNSDYATLLSGRYLKTHVYPIAFHELLQNAGITTYLQLLQKKASVLHQMNTLMQFGGFPKIHCMDSNPQRIELLKSYYETILLKDCIANHAIRDASTFTQLAHYIMSNVATLYSYNKLSTAISSNEHTTQQFIRLLENAYIFNEKKSFSYSIRTQLHSHKKIYCIDNGLITATAFQFSENHGKLFENLVYTEFKKTSDAEIYFFNDTKECDFILHDQKSTLAIQTCYQLTPENRTREIAGIASAMKKFLINKGVIITYDQEEKISPNIHAIPFWKYFSMLIP